ncbi:MAG: DNA double-strand break repair protein Mre11, partial [Haloferacaceae archaeon]
MTRVIHTGDTHVGYQQYHSPERRRDFLDAFEQVVADAIADDVDAVVHAGDLFHDRRPDLQDLLGVLDLLRRLADADVPFLAIVGNHESTRGGQWLDLFERLDLATRLDATPHVVGDVAFYGLDHVPKSRRDELDYDFASHDAAHAAVVAHGLFTPFAHADWETEEVLSASPVDFDAMLLGDNHVPDTAQVRDTWVTYCGSTERTSASEEAGRGYNTVEFTGGEVDVRRRGLDTRPFVFVDVELAEGEGGDRVRDRVRQHDLDDAVVVVDVTGEGDPITPASVEETALDEGALVARVRDRREVETESDLAVSFADPDEAVRERVEEMGLSRAALDVDETIRASKVADANVREEVTTRVRERIDDPGAFDPAPDGDGDEAAGGDSDAADDAGGDAESDTEATTDAGGDAESDTEATTDAGG